VVTALAGAPAEGRVGGWRRPPGLTELTRLSWVTWRQHRAALIGVGVFAAAMAVYMLQAGLQVHNLWDAGVRDGCVLPTRWTAECRPILSPFDVGWPVSYVPNLGLLLPLFPVAAGMFVGAPLLAREYVAGTTRFAWTQSTDRTRLVATKIVLLGLAVMVAGAVLGWLAQWSVQPVLALSAEGFDRWMPGLFDYTPVLEAAAAGLAFALAVLAGVVIRHVVPAIAVTAVATIVWAELSYKHLYAWMTGLGLHHSVDQALGTAPNVATSGDMFFLHEAVKGGTPGPAGAWLDQGWYADAAGHRVSTKVAENLPYHSVQQLNQMHITFQITWQPAGRYWLFQFGQGGAEVLLALLLGALAVWLVRRRMA
jgi:hypothetical protein